MRLGRRLAFLALVLVPLSVLGWLGYRVARDERQVVRSRLERLLRAHLEDGARPLAARMDAMERDLAAITGRAALDTEGLRELVRREPLVGQVLLLGGTGRLLHPPPGPDLGPEEAAFLARVRRLVEDRTLVRRPRPDRGAPRQPGDGPAATGQSGWIPSFWENGLHLLFWRHLPGDRVLAIEIDPTRLKADLVAELPDTDPAARGAREGRIALVEADGATIYQWGAYEPPEGEEPVATLPLEAPLGAWHLAYFASPASLAPGGLAGSLAFNLTAGLAALALALVGLAVYFYRDYARDVREAGERVRFTDQVSHELKTPLTNIRMYAELLAGRLDEDPDPVAREHVAIIVSESQRLSRMIGNVLTFSRSSRGKLRLERRPGVVDEGVAAVLEQFRPSLAARGVRIEVDARASKPVLLDGDALGQMVGNLVSNVEKYAWRGGLLRIETRQEGDGTTITVSDRGPGIPAGEAESVFRAFHRSHNEITEGVSGTGIGLTIARELAELHGGTLCLVPAAAGASFRLTLHTPPAEPPAAASKDAP